MNLNNVKAGWRPGTDVTPRMRFSVASRDMAEKKRCNKAVVIASLDRSLSIRTEEISGKVRVRPELRARQLQDRSSHRSDGCFVQYLESANLSWVRWRTWNEISSGLLKEAVQPVT